MKILLSFILMLSLCVNGFAQSYNNGAYVSKGKTFEVDKKVHQIITTNTPDTLYFSNELIVKVYTNSDFAVNSFFQEIINKNKISEKAKFGNHNFSATLMNGSAILFYSGGDSNSSCIVSTPMMDLELHKGTFYINVTENKVFAFVLDGSLESHGERNKVIDITSGYAVIAAPIEKGILEAKISLDYGKVKADLIKKLTNESKDILPIKGTIMFALIDGKLVGIVID